MPSQLSALIHQPQINTFQSILSEWRRVLISCTMSPFYSSVSLQLPNSATVIISLLFVHPSVHIHSQSCLCTLHYFTICPIHSSTCLPIKPCNSILNQHTKSVPEIGDLPCPAPTSAHNSWSTVSQTVMFQADQFAVENSIWTCRITTSSLWEFRCLLFSDT